MQEDSYDGYAYAYPHKTSYRPLDPPVPLDEAWRHEDRSKLFLYTHLPFCEMRCGFCNLFTTVQPDGGLVGETLASIQRQSEIVAELVQPEGVAQVAIGGGTPSFLAETELESLFAFLSQSWPVDWQAVPVSFEVSPGTISAAKLALLKKFGVDRISMGVQSFVREDLLALKRPQPMHELDRACDAISSAGIPVFNIDLIYGIEGQDAARWQQSLDRALHWEPEELYLYPLYIGERTKLDRCGKRPGIQRRELYRQAREFLLAAGYTQVSMRLFRRADVTRWTDYCCQDDGMVGLGPGARSYTRGLHYSSEYAVGQVGVKRIIEAFNQLQSTQFSCADYGVALDPSEQKLRFLIKSLLRADGLSHEAYASRFGSAVEVDFPQLVALSQLDLVDRSHTSVVRLNAEGLSWSDTIGPWLYSDPVIEKMQAYELV